MSGDRLPAGRSRPPVDLPEPRVACWRFKWSTRGHHHRTYDLRLTRLAAATTVTPVFVPLPRCVDINTVGCLGSQKMTRQRLHV